MGKQTAVIGGKKQLTRGFPRQGLQLPTQPSSQRVSPVCSLSHFSLWPAPRHTIPQQKAYAGHSLKVLATTFTHLPFETDNYHMWPKSPPWRLLRAVSASWGIQRGRVRAQRGLGEVSRSWGGRSSRADGLWEKSGWQGSFLFGEVKGREGRHSWTQDLYLCSLSAVLHVFSIPADEEINQSAGWLSSVGRMIRC